MNEKKNEIEFIQFTVGGKKYPKVKIRNRCTCLRCGRKLSNPKSIARGMGPVCWRKTHLDLMLRMKKLEVVFG